MDFIDIHGHYAWGVDDGIPSIEEAAKALKKAKKNHISAIVATPHVVPGTHTSDDLKAILQRIHELELMASHLNIQIYHGCELFLNHDCIHAIHQGLFIPIGNTNYLLAEFDVRKELSSEDEVEDYLYEIAFKGYTPIIAHVERYFRNDIDLERIKEFVNNGYIIQINASSLLGVHGKTVKKNAYKLIDEGLAHIIATDTHRANGHRTPCMQNVYDQLSKDYSEDILKTLMYDNPFHIIHNEPVETIKVKRSFFKRILRRR